MSDSDIFAPPKGMEERPSGDANIFSAPPESPQVQTQQPSIPDRSFSQYTADRAKTGGMNLLRGFIRGGPMGASMAGLGEGLQTIGDATERLGYNVGGKVTDLTGSPEAGYAANVTAQLIPTVLSGRASQAVASPAMRSAAERVMQMALKPPLAASQKMFAPGVTQAQAAVNTLLERGINPTNVAALEGQRAALAAARQQQLAASGATVPAREVADYVPNALDKFRFGPQATAAADELGKVQEAFLAHPELAGRTDIPIQLAEKLKQGYQAAVGAKYGAQVTNPTLSAIETEGEKQVARGLRELMARNAPQVAESLGAESQLINARKLAERRAAMSGNNQIVGLGWMNPMMMPLWLAERNPTLGGLMARALNSGRNVIPYLGGAYGGGSLVTPGAVAPGEQPMLDLPALDGALYSPPPRGAPPGRLGGGSR